QVAVIAGGAFHVAGAVHDRRIPDVRGENEGWPALIRINAGPIPVPPAIGRIHPAAIVVAVPDQRPAALLQGALALRALGLLPGGLERREKQRDQDGDDADDHEELDQRKSPTPKRLRTIRRFHSRFSAAKCVLTTSFLTRKRGGTLNISPIRGFPLQ